MEEKIFIMNSKGLRLSSVISYPDKTKKYPAILILSGFMGQKEEKHIKELAETLVRNKIMAVRFDCSGLGESGGMLEKDYYMPNYLEDIWSVYKYVKKLKFVDENRMGVVGYSLGGILSVIFASENPEIKVCTAVSTPSTIFTANLIKALLRNWQKKKFKKEVFRKTRRMGLPLRLIVDANKFNALNSIQKVHCPFLVIFGLEDDLVNPSDSKKIFSAANEPKKIIGIKGLGHEHQNYPKAIKKINEEILAFLGKYL